MSSIRFDIDVQDGDIADKIERRIEAGMREAVRERNQQSIGQMMKRAAREHIARHGRVWTTELIRSFDIIVDLQGDTVMMTLRNDAGHAATVDMGAEYGDEGPPLHKLIPWVESKLKGYKVRGGNLIKYENAAGGKTILTDGSGNRPHVTIELPPEYDLGAAVPFSEIGQSGGANIDSSYLVDYEGRDEKAFFQEFKEFGGETSGWRGSQYGTVRNEELFTRISMETGWTLGPENTGGQVINPAEDEILEGNFQAWVDGQQLRKHMEQPYHADDADMTWTPTEFVEEHEEWFARTGAMDILLGNGDRHTGNIMIDDDLQPHAIDNGGHVLPSGGDLADRISDDSVYFASDFKHLDEYPGLENALLAMYQTQLDNLELLLTEHSDAILEHTRDVHGSKSALYARMEAIVNADVQNVLDIVEDIQGEVMENARGNIDHIDNDISFSFESANLDLPTGDSGDVINDIMDDFRDL